MEKGKLQCFNFILISLILICEILLPRVLSFRYDILFVSLFILINIKGLIKGYKTNKLMYILSTLYVAYKFIQAFILKMPSDSLITVCWNAIYGILNTLGPLILFVSFLSVGKENKYSKYLHHLLLLITSISIIYGLITFIFNFDLSSAGMYVINYENGRIISTFGNPNGYGLFLILMLNYMLYNKFVNKYIQYSFLLLIIISVCLTFSRFMYFLLLLSIFVYIILIIVSKRKNKSIENPIAVIVIMILTLFLPHNDYLYLSIINTFDHTFNTNIGVIFDSNNVLKKIKSSDLNEKSSANTRKVFYDTAFEIFKDNQLIGVGDLNYHNEMNERIIEKNIDYLKSGLPHNYYIYILAVDGLIGFLIIIAIVLVVIYKIWPKNKNDSLQTLMIYVSFLVANFTGDYMMKYFLVYVIMSISIGNKIYDNKMQKLEE